MLKNHGRWTDILRMAMAAAFVLCSSPFVLSRTGPDTPGQHYRLKTFEKFLEQHPSIAADLAKNPSLIKDPRYIAEHPELKQFLHDHPGLPEEVMAKADDCSMALASLFDRASPSVVYIYATSINPYRTSNRVEHVVGSGFIFDPSGLILTNSHVAYGRQSIIVGLEDGSTESAELVGADPVFDIAVLRIPKPKDRELSVLPLGDSDRVHVGHEAVAIGNPLGLDQTLTRGIVSAVNRILPVTFFSGEEPLIQIDTPINPGNSGGPLLDGCGQVVGITTAIIPGAQNIGFAIPVNLIKSVLPSLLSQGHVARPWLGFHGQFIDNNLQSLLRMQLATGFLVEVIEPGSPAATAGLQGGELEMEIGGHEFLLGGDIVTKMNGIELSSVEAGVRALGEVKIGSTVSLSVFRDGKTIEVNYTVPERPLLPGDIAGQNMGLPIPESGPPRFQPNNRSWTLKTRH
ncbi:MAG TPA: trypsin-like peptidase domain-containing protein [Blastocatellia bacterium]|nr:trypsin-like peptidase domain-containing protein [Blastocatellia bacterium]